MTIPTGRRVLIAEHNALTASALNLLVVHWGGISCGCVTSRQALLDAAVLRRSDLILANFDLLYDDRGARELLDRHPVPIIALVSRCLPPGAMACPDLRYLEMPFSTAALGRAMADALDEPSSARLQPARGWQEPLLAAS